MLEHRTLIPMTSLYFHFMQFDGFIDLESYDTLAIKLKGDGRCYISTVSDFAPVKFLEHQENLLSCFECFELCFCSENASVTNKYVITLLKPRDKLIEFPCDSHVDLYRKLGEFSWTARRQFMASICFCPEG